MPGVSARRGPTWDAPVNFKVPRGTWGWSTAILATATVSPGWVPAVVILFGAVQGLEKLVPQQSRDRALVLHHVIHVLDQILGALLPHRDRSTEPQDVGAVVQEIRQLREELGDSLRARPEETSRATTNAGTTAPVELPTPRSADRDAAAGVPEHGGPVGDAA